MNINDKLNLVLPIRFDEAGNATLYAYHTPISREVFELNWRMIGATYATIWDDPKYARSTAAVRIATLALKEAGRTDDGLDLAGALLADIKRLTMVVAPTTTGFKPQMIDVAIGRNLITKDDYAEVESALVFFTCVYSMTAPSRQANLATALAPALRGSMSSLKASEFADSLPRSTVAETSETPIISSVAS